VTAQQQGSALQWNSYS